MFWRRVFKVGRLLSEKARVVSLGLRYGAGFSGRDLSLATGVHVSLTDGGVLAVGTSCTFDRQSTVIVKRGKLELGDSVYVGVGAVLCAQNAIHIGSNVLIAEYVTIRDQDHVFPAWARQQGDGFKTSPIHIGDDVWLGAKVSVTRGVTIGSGSVIGANSVVTQSVPPNVLAAGAPARVIRRLEATPREHRRGA